MIVAAHHLKGTPQHEFHERLKKYMGEGGTPEFWPQKPWPEKCFVQWGIGIVPAGVSFFEAFPGNDDTAGGFIRGEGSTLEEAEASAFAKYERQHECQHLWGREDYKNGYALCRRCRAGRSGLFKELFILGQWRRPLKPWEATDLERHEQKTPDPQFDAELERKHPGILASLEKMYKLQRLQRHLFGVEELQPLDGHIPGKMQ